MALLMSPQDGKDVKGTKQKTKPQKKTHDPLFEEEFTYDITKKTPIDANSRVQVTVCSMALLMVSPFG